MDDEPIPEIEAVAGKEKFSFTDLAQPIGAGIVLFTLGIGAGFMVAFSGLGFFEGQISLLLTGFAAPPTTIPPGRLKRPSNSLRLRLRAWSNRQTENVYFGRF